MNPKLERVGKKQELIINQFEQRKERKICSEFVTKTGKKSPLELKVKQKLWEIMREIKDIL